MFREAGYGVVSEDANYTKYGKDIYVGANNKAGILNISGSTLVFGGDFGLSNNNNTGYQSKPSPLSMGDSTVNITGSTVTTEGSFRIGGSYKRSEGEAYKNATVNIEGSTVNVKGNGLYFVAAPASQSGNAGGDVTLTMNDGAHVKLQQMYIGNGITGAYTGTTAITLKQGSVIEFTGMRGGSEATGSWNGFSKQNNHVKVNLNLEGGTIILNSSDADRVLFNSFSATDNITLKDGTMTTISVTSPKEDVDGLFYQAQPSVTGNVAVMKGTGGLIKDGKGTLVINQDNTYSGATNIDKGTLQLGNGGTIGSLNADSVITVSNDANLKVNRSNTYQIDNKILGEGNLIQAGRGTTIITNTANNFSGDTSIIGGVLQFNSLASMGAGETDISTGVGATKGTLKLNFADATTLARDVNGTGNFEKSEAGVLTLNGDLTHTGKTTVSGGEVIVSAGKKIEGTSDVLIDNGSDYATNSNVAKLTVNGSLTTAQTGDDSGDVEINNGTFTVAAGGTATVGNIKTTDEAGADQATVTVLGELTTNLVNGDVLFQNFKKAAATDTITFNGTWNANVAEGATVKQQEGAGFTGTGTFNKDGKGELDFTADNTIANANINDGTVKVKAGTKFKTTETLTVGNTKDGKNTAILDNAGVVEAKNIIVNSDGNLINSGTARATNDLTVDGGQLDSSGTTAAKNLIVDNNGTVNITAGRVVASVGAKVNSGTVTVGSDGTLSVGTGTSSTENLELNGGDLKVAGTVNAKNIISNPAEGSDIDAKIAIDSTGKLNLKPASGDTLFNGIDTTQGDEIKVNGELNVTVADGTVNQAENAGLSGTGTLNKDGAGELALQADNTIGTTNVKDGKVSVATGKTLNSGTVNVGDSTGSAGSAALDILGTLDNVTNLNVKADGSVNVGDTTNTGTVNTDNLTVDGGTVDVNKGTVGSKATNLNAGNVTVDKDGTLNGGVVKVGDGNGDAGTATLTNEGQVTASSVTVEKDGNVTNNDGKLDAGDALTVNGGTVDVNKGTVEADATNINDGTVTVDNGAKLDGGAITVGDGDSDAAQLVANGEVTADSVTVNKDGTLNVGDDTNKGSLAVEGSDGLVVNGGTVDVNNGSVETPKTTINDGDMTVVKEGTLNGGEIKVGDGNGDAGTATLTNAGQVNASSVTVEKDGKVTNNDGTLDAGDALSVNGGTVDVNKGTVGAKATNINDGDVTVAKDGALDGGVVKVGDGNGDAGTATLTNAGQVTASSVTVEKDGNLTNNDGKLDAGDALTVNGGTVDVNKGTVGAKATNINDGDVTVAKDGTLNGGEIKVGDGNGDAGTATLTNAGQVTASSVTVEKDSNLTNNDGKLDAGDALSVNGGTVDVNKGTVEADATNINDGAVNVAKDGTLNGGDITVGDGNGTPDSAKLTSSGTVNADTLDVKKDGNLTIENGEVTAANGATVNGGNVQVNQDGTLTSGTLPNDLKDFAVNSGNVQIDGTLNAKNITSDLAQDDSADDAKINVSKDGNLNLKPADGDTLFNGLDTSKGDAINLDGALNVDVDEGTVSQQNTADITGSGTLNKAGEGELKLTADNKVAETNVNDGTLTIAQGSTLDSDKINVGNKDIDAGSNDSSSPDTLNIEGKVNTDALTVKDNGEVNLDNGGKLTTDNNVVVDGGALNVNNGELTADNIITTDTNDEKASSVNVGANGTLTLNPNDGDKLFDGFNTTATGKDAIEIAGKLNVNVADNTTVTQDVNSPINGTGEFNKNGKGTFDVKADNPFSGDVNVNDGTLYISKGGKLGNATVNVKPDATLSVNEEGTSLGNLNLDGTLKVVATPDGHTKINVAGNADISNGKLFTDIAGSNEEDLKNGRFENVITAGGNIIGDQFASYDDNSALFDFVPYVSPDKKSVGLTPYSSEGNSLVEIANQFGLDRASGAARALDTNFKNSPANELSRLFYTIRDKQQAADALLASLPTLAGASSQVIADTSRALADLATIYDRCESDLLQKDKNLWVRTFGSFGQQNAYKGAAGYNDDTYGFAVGAEKCHQQTRLGVMMGYAYDNVHSRESVSDQSVKAETIQLGVYGNTPVSSLIDLDFRAGIGYSDVSTQRTINFANRSAKADYGNKLAYAGLGVNFSAYSSDNAEIKPFVRMDYQVVRNNHYQEKGAGVLNLQADAGTNQALVSKAGIATQFRVADKVSVGARAAVGYDLIGEPAEVRAAFAGAPDLKFTTKGAQHGRVSGEMGVDIRYQITPAASLSLSYDADVRKGYVEHTPTVSFKMAF
ncbi:autotransporter domain-containing protein [Gallibacterium melopsittaci]|uniref:Autotransporter domain-containing protein n=1 Tax=Gallibacterium melopsittaci TaxID=516063 RepID=A0ABV6HV46_9PAST